MSEKQITIDDLTTILSEKSTEFARLFVTAFEGDWSVGAGSPVRLAEFEAAESLASAGLAYRWELEAHPIALLIPAGDLLPDGFAEPDDDQTKHLDDLSIGLTKLFFPGEEPALEAKWEWIEPLSDRLSNFEADPAAGLLPIEIFSQADAAKGQELYLVATGFEQENLPEQPIEADETEEPPTPEDYVAEDSVAEDPVDNVSDESSDFDDASVDDTSFDDGFESDPDVSDFGSRTVSDNQIIDRVRRILNLNVTVSVRLAEKKIDLGQLISLCPGTLIMFQKSCDDLLDFYVNNQLYAEGEAVKIGEKFGIKINDVGTKHQRRPGVFSL